MEQTRATRRRSQLFDHRGELAVYIVLVVLALSLIILPDTYQRQAASYVEDFALYPFRQGALLVTRIHTLWDRNRQLSEEVEALRLELMRTAEIRLENERLRDMLDLSRRSDLQLVGCEILAEGGGRLGGQTLLLDRGSLQGVRHNMPVTGRDGLAGKVYEVYPETARAILLTHRWCAVSVRDTRSRLTGIVEWNPHSASTLKLRGVSYLEDVAVGDSLVTSGLSGIYPAGLPVGEVVQVERDVNGLLLDVTLRPTVDLARLEEVFVLVGPPGDVPIGTDPLATPVTEPAVVDPGAGERRGADRGATESSPGDLGRTAPAAGDAVVELQ